MDPTIDEMLRVYAAALCRHRQHIEDRCDKRAWHVLARHLIERATLSLALTAQLGEVALCRARRRRRERDGRRYHRLRALRRWMPWARYAARGVGRR